jgi:glycoside/pentoside/hexuronide:cation symporter, GPH family
VTPPQDPERLGFSKLLMLVFPAVPLSAMGLPLAIFVPPFYASLFQAGGMSAAASMALVGTSFMIVRTFDLITDPLMGVLGDRYDSRWGRRRHWCVIAAPVVMLGVVAVFVVPFPGLVSPAYLIVSMLIFYVGSTMYNISLYAWGAELSRDYHERSRITAYLQFALLLGNLTVLVPPAYMELVAGARAGGHASLMASGAYILLLLPIATFLAVTRVPERPSAPAPRVSFWHGTRLILRNRYMRRLLFADLLIGIPGGVMASMFIFYLRDVIGAGEWTSAIMISTTAITVAGVPIWLWLSRRLSKHRTFCISAFLAGVNVALFLALDYGDVLAFAILLNIGGIIYAGHAMLIRSMAADIVDSDNLESGGQRTGLFYSLITTTSKVSGALAIGITYPLLGLFGFDPSAATQTDQAVSAIRYIFTLLPALAFVSAAAVMWSFPLDHLSQLKLRLELESRDRARGILS